jgi:N-acetyl-anhydromuramyl-L-alanine amidase AmpD
VKISSSFLVLKYKYKYSLPATNSGHAHGPEVQYQIYVRGIEVLQKAYGVPTTRVKGHKEIAALLGRKIDPNLSMDEFRSKLG